jgi:hypothetical protein
MAKHNLVQGSVRPMVSRRAFVAAAAAPFLASGTALASTVCHPSSLGPLCTSQVDFVAFAQRAYQNQQMSQWCWAACVSMVFDYYGHRVSQERIVREVYGAPVDMPAGAGIVLAQQLNRAWKDDRGVAFNSRVTAAYDFDARVFNMNNAWLVNELDQGRPVVLGCNSHAVVMTAMTYAPTPAGPSPTAVGVFDPWPGRGARGLSQQEMVPVYMGGGLRFAASVQVL